jgi:hypothetical protein
MNALVDLETLPSGVTIRVGRAKAAREPTIVPYQERDRRSLSHMDPDTLIVHARLERWGKETREGFTDGWPAVTLLGRVIEQGAGGASQPGRPVSTISESSQQVDACVARLWKRAQSCTRRYYQQWEPIEVMARKEGVGLTQFREILRRSRQLIGFWLDDLPKE